jgi:two-component system sensor histidine kinase BaeS
MATAPPAESRARRRVSLVTQLTVLLTVVALLAALVTFVVALPLIRESAERQAQRELSGQADLLADLVEARSIAAVDDSSQLPALQDALSRDDVDVDVVASVDELPVQLTAADRAALAEGAVVSGTRAAGGTEYLVEARSAFPFALVVLSQPTSIARNDVERTGLLRLVYALLAGVVLAVVLGSLLARRVARPLTHVRAAAYRLSHGERSVRVEPEGPAEVAEVAEALNALASALRVSEARQREFLLSVSHELRTPLTAVRGYAEALADGVVDGSEVRPTGAVVQAEADRLDRLVTDLLDLARLGAQDLRLDLVEVDLVALVRDAGQVWADRGAAVGVLVDVDVPAQPLPAVTDPTRVRQILDNLAENALRVTPSGAHLVLAVRADPDGARVLEVRDGGPGLTDDDIAVAFEPSALYERYRGVRQVGSGVGLALVGRLAGLLGGRAEAGRADGGGALFRVVLSRSAPNGAAGESAG